MPRVLVVDTYYPDFLKSITVDVNAGYEENLKKVLGRCFGTFDAYSRILRALGWEAIDVIANHEQLQEMWARENKEIFRYNAGAPVLNGQIFHYRPDVIFMQDLSAYHPKYDNAILAGQLSCPWPGDEVVRQYDVLFSSFPHYIPRIEALGVRAVYNPLAFEPSILERLTTNNKVATTDNNLTNAVRPHDVVFIGGTGNPSHWKYGMSVLETVALYVPNFKWWGYGSELLPPDSLLRQKYQGEAYGLDMYEILLQSKICLNRHGEVAEGYSNNMRMFEATGCGALLLTEDSPNLTDFFDATEAVSYLSPGHAVDRIRFFLEHDEARQRIAANGQKRTLRDHTYQRRMITVSDTLKEMLCPA